MTLPEQSDMVELSERDLRAAVVALELGRLRGIIPASVAEDAHDLERRLAAEWRERRRDG